MTYTPLEGPNLAKPQNLAKQTLSDPSTRLKYTSKVRFAHSTTHYAVIPPRFCCGLGLGDTHNFAVCPFCEILLPGLRTFPASLSLLTMAAHTIVGHVSDLYFAYSER